VALAEIYDFSGNAHSKLANISTRALVQTGDNVLVGGLIVGGDVVAKMILRAIGPSLVSSGITNRLAAPILERHDSEALSWARITTGRVIQPKPLKSPPAASPRRVVGNLHLPSLSHRATTPPSFAAGKETTVLPCLRLTRCGRSDRAKEPLQKCYVSATRASVPRRQRHESHPCFTSAKAPNRSSHSHRPPAALRAVPGWPRGLSIGQRDMVS
jgi:hypothetical protein